MFEGATATFRIKESGVTHSAVWCGLALRETLSWAQCLELSKGDSNDVV